MKDTGREIRTQSSPDIISSDIFYPPEDWEDTRSPEQVAYDKVKSVDRGLQHDQYYNGKAFDAQVEAVTHLIPFVDTPERCVRFLDQIYLPDGHARQWKEAIEHAYQNRDKNGQIQEEWRETVDELNNEWEDLGEPRVDLEQ